jgi:hypothetical protein
MGILILSHTPHWVYGLFVAVLVFGFQQTRSRSINAYLAFSLPIGMIALAIAGISSSFGLTLAPLAAWAIGLLTVTALGFVSFRDDRITFTPSSRTFFIPGSWVPLVVIMAIFFTKYVFAVMRDVDSEIAKSSVFVAALSLAYGCVSGYFSSRAVDLALKARGA